MTAAASVNRGGGIGQGAAASLIMGAVMAASPLVGMGKTALKGGTIFVGEKQNMPLMAKCYAHKMHLTDLLIGLHVEREGGWLP